MFKVNKKDTRTTVFIVKFEQIMQKQLPSVWLEGGSLGLLLQYW